jgi:aminoglycoside phosphotransferase family enzyme/predicted kinase
MALHARRTAASSHATTTGDHNLDRLIAALCAPERYGHPVQEVEVLQTHISCVLLAGDYAYKIKKPVNLGFLDFSTLAARRHYCEEELRLNRRTAPALYLDVIPIGGSVDVPLLGAGGPAFEYALRMKRFAQDALLDRMARRGELTAQHVETLAASLAAFHANVARAGDRGTSAGHRGAGAGHECAGAGHECAGAGPQCAFGSPERILAQAMQNFEQLQVLAAAGSESALLARLRRWTAETHAALAPLFEARRQALWVRECHGDLHLGNIALLAGVPTPFDGIEFSEDLRWIDVMSEVAFLVMDLIDHRLPRLAFAFLNAYLESTGDYAGVRVLRFYLVYRALVRAKVSCMRAHQPGSAAGVEHEYRRHLHLAERLAAPGDAALLIMHGLSGSGKTTVARNLQDSLGALRLRSDVERKRLHGLATLARSASGLNAGLYASGASERTYAHLAGLAREVLSARYPVIVDAAFLQRAQRERFAALARSMGAGFAIATCIAAPATLRERVALREKSATDASEASLEVLEQQLLVQEPIAADEAGYALEMNTEPGADAARVARRLRLTPL